MWEEKPSFEVASLRGRLRLEGTWTEVIVRGFHRPALVSLVGRRIGDGRRKTRCQARRRS